MKEQVYIITMLVRNKPSVTSRVTALFSGRGYNMESICGAPTHDPHVSRITIKTQATQEKFQEIQAQLNRLIDVIKLRDMTHIEKAVKREMALISISTSSLATATLHQLLASRNAKVLNESTDSYIVEVTGSEEEVDALIDDLRPYDIKKLTRSGVLALYRELDDTHNSR